MLKSIRCGFNDSVPRYRSTPGRTLPGGPFTSNTLASMAFDPRYTLGKVVRVTTVRS
jgi:hypothetical protein